MVFTLPPEVWAAMEAAQQARLDHRFAQGLRDYRPDILGMIPEDELTRRVTFAREAAVAAGVQAPGCARAG